MLQNKFEMPLDLVVKDSKIFRFHLTLILFLSFISVLISALVLSVKIFLCATLLFLLFLYFNKQSVNKITSLKLSKDNKWELEIDRKHNVEAELQGECIVIYFLVWLNFTTTTHFHRKKQLHILLLPDSADKDLLRKLRVRLRFFSDDKKEKMDANVV